MEKNMRNLHTPAKEITTNAFYEGHIREINKQLYDAYKRIAELTEELKKEREKNGKD